MKGFHAYPTRISQHLFTAGRQFVFTASISSGAVDRKKEMLRKKYHVVRKKNHVVRKLFYVASIFDGAAGRKNRPPWKKVTAAGEVFPTASRTGWCGVISAVSAGPSPRSRWLSARPPAL